MSGFQNPDWLVLGISADTKNHHKYGQAKFYSVNIG